MVRSHGVAALLVALGAAACDSGDAPPKPGGPAAVAPAPTPPREAPPAAVPRSEDKSHLAPWERETDPVRARTLKLQEEWRLHPLLTDVPLRFHDQRPVLVAFEADDPGGKSAAAATVAGGTLAALAGDFRAFLVEAGAEAPMLAEMGDVRLRLLILRSERSRERWRLAYSGRAGGPAWHDPRERLMIGFVPFTEPEVWREVGTFALLNEYRRWFLQREEEELAREEGVKAPILDPEDARLSPDFAWLERGLSWHFAGREAAPGGVEGRKPDPREEFLRVARRTSVGLKVEEFLFLDAASVRARARDGRSSFDEFNVSLHGKTLVRTFLEGASGRWRKPFLEYVKRSVQCRGGKAEFLDSFGLPRRADDPRVQAWLAEVDAAFRGVVEGK